MKSTQSTESEVSQKLFEVLLANSPYNNHITLDSRDFTEDKANIMQQFQIYLECL